MKNYHLTATTTLLLSLLAMISIACADSTMQIGPTNSDITSGGGCDFWRAKSEEPKLVKTFFDNGKYAHINYEHESGNPILLEGYKYEGNNQKLLAALNIDGKEVLLNYAKGESIQCVDKTYNKKISCETHEYINKTLRVKIIQLTNQSACFPHTDACAGNSVSASVTVTNETSRISFVVVGHCGG